MCCMNKKMYLIGYAVEIKITINKTHCVLNHISKTELDVVLAETCVYNKFH